LREGVVQQAPRQWLAFWAVDDVFSQGLPETLGDAANNLSFDQPRVDDTATVVDSDIAQDTYRPRLSVHLDDYGMRAKGKWGSRESVSATENQPALWRDGVGAWRSPSLHRAMHPARGSSYKLCEGQLLFWLVAIERAPVLKIDVLGWTRK